MTQPKPPDAIPLVLGNKTLATAYPHRPPGAREANWSWRMVFSKDGSRHQNSLGRLAPADVPQALLDAWQKIDPVSIVEDRTDIQTVVDLCRAWYASLETRPDATRLSENSLNVYRISCEYIRDTIGSRKLATLKGQDVQDLVDLMAAPDFRQRREQRLQNARSQNGQPPLLPPKGRGYGLQTINQTLVVLCIAFKWGRQQKYEVPELNPTRYRLKARKGVSTARYRDYTPTAEETQAFYDKIRRCNLKMVYLVAWRAGGRIGEIAGLRWGDIQRERDGYFIRLNGKTGLRRVAVPDEVAQELLSYRKGAPDEQRLFSANANVWMSASLVLTEQRHGLPEDKQFSFHALRRRWCLDMIDSGVPVSVSVYADQAGHSAEVALEHYARINDRDRRAATLRMDERGGSNDIYAFLADRGMTVQDAIEIILEHTHLCKKRPFRVIAGGSHGEPSNEPESVR